MAGAEPPHKGGRLRPTAQMRGESEEARELLVPLPQTGWRTSPGQGSARGLREFALILECTRSIFLFDTKLAHNYDQANFPLRCTFLQPVFLPGSDLMRFPA